jgi:hypothetical protein
MPIYSLKRIEEINGTIIFYKLLKGNNCQYDEFWEQCVRDGNYEIELDKISAVIYRIANKMPVQQPNKQKDITPENEEIREYEIRTKNLRIYTIILPKTGNVVVLGGKKNKQKKDIPKFRNIKKEFLKEYLN